jgi:hypothetical protein
VGGDEIAQLLDNWRPSLLAPLLCKLQLTAC